MLLLSKWYSPEIPESFAYIGEVMFIASKDVAQELSINSIHVSWDWKGMLALGIFLVLGDCSQSYSLMANLEEFSVGKVGYKWC